LAIYTLAKELWPGFGDTAGQVWRKKPEAGG